MKKKEKKGKIEKKKMGKIKKKLFIVVIMENANETCLMQLGEFKIIGFQNFL